MHPNDIFRLFNQNLPGRKLALVFLIAVTAIFVFTASVILNTNYAKTSLRDVDSVLLTKTRSSLSVDGSEGLRSTQANPTGLIPSRTVQRFYKYVAENRYMDIQAAPGRRFVVFLKVHKAASTTVQNILLRHAIFNNLYVVFHKENPHLNEHGKNLSKESLVEIPRGRHFNILCHHIVFDKAEISKYFPKDTLYIGIVREPFERFVSSFFYYAHKWNESYIRRCIRNYPNDPILGYLENPFMCEPQRTSALKKSQTLSRMSRDFGFPSENLQKAVENATIIKEFIQQVDSDFDFVMVAEYFDESVVLLRRLLRWSLKDMIYVKQNVHQGNEKIQERKSILNDTHRQLYAKWAPVEIHLYEHFKHKFLDLLQSQREDFHDELTTFKMIRQDVENYCNSTWLFSPLVVPGGNWTKTFNVTRTDCAFLGMEESMFTTVARHFQDLRVRTLFRRFPGWRNKA